MPRSLKRNFNRAASQTATTELKPVELTPPSHRRPCLLILSGIEAGRVIPIDLDAGPVTIGRDAACDIVIEGPEVSRHHARIDTIDGEPAITANAVILVDLDSHNGTYVNNERIRRCHVQWGDRLRFGPHSVFKVLFQDEEELEYAELLYNRANCDHLTGLANRSYFSQAVERDWAHAKRHRQPLSLAMLDIDRFKSVNDSHGHLVGDQVLRQFVERLKMNIRIEDLLARYGGEEFVILLRGTGLQGACSQAERLRVAVEEAPFHIGGADIPVTVSIGVTTVLGDAFDSMTTQELMRCADNQLYNAKAKGRNRVACALARVVSALEGKNTPGLPTFPPQFTTTSKAPVTRVVSTEYEGE